jgi:energy-coupling factor transporter transmembrane protein EcfT
MRLHPYAILLGVVIGIVTLFTLRHPLFALMSGLIAVLGLDMILRVKKGGDGS